MPFVFLRIEPILPRPAQVRHPSIFICNVFSAANNKLPKDWKSRMPASKKYIFNEFFIMLSMRKYSGFFL